MSGHSLAYFMLILVVISRSGFGQLPPDMQKKDRPQHPVAVKLLGEIIEQRSQLKLTGDIDSLKSSLADIDRLVAQTKEVRELEIRKSGLEAPTTKRLNLLVEGFERLSDRVARITTLVEKKEHRLAAETMRFVAAMDRAWTGKYDPDSQPLVKSARDQSELASAQTSPFESLKKQIQTEINAKRFAEVRKLYSQLVEEQRSQLGPDHSEVADTISSLSYIEYTQANLERTIELEKMARDILEQIYDKSHWYVRRIEVRLQSLERLLKISPELQARVIGVETDIHFLENALRQRTAKERQELLVGALAGLKLIHEQVGTDSFIYAKSMSFVARAYSKYQNPSEANYRFELADRAMRALKLDQTADYANLMSQWSGVCKVLGDDERAINLIRDAIDINRKVQGEEHLEYIIPMENFGTYFFQSRAFDKALFVYEKVAKLRFALSGPTDLSYLQAREKIAATLFSLRRFKEAEPLLTELSAQRKPEPGSENVLDISLAHMQGNLAERQGKHDAAIRHFEHAVELEERVHGKNDKHYAVALANLAGSLMRSGNDPRIGTLLTDALKIDRAHVDRVSHGQTERQHFRTLEEFRPSLFLYLTFAINAGNQDREAYDQILAWKGRSFRERWASNASRHAAATQLLDAYVDLCRRLSNFATSIDQLGEKAPDQTQFMKLVEDKERVWRTLTRTTVSTNDVVQATADEIQKAIPNQVALVDYLYYKHLTIPDAADPVFEQRILAVIVRAGQPVKLIPVGSAKSAETAILTWRKELKAGQGIADAKASNASQQHRLRAQLWTPVEEYLQGITTVVICPDGMLDLLPWDALPSQKAGQYLIEDYAIHKTPVAQFVVRANRSSTDAVSMLLLGNPTYEVKVSGPEVPLNGMRFGALPGTANEVAAIAKLYDSQKSEGKFAPLQLLQGHSATEPAVRQLSTDARYLHLATHGFFRPEVWQLQKAGPLQTNARKQVRTFAPEVLSGIALTAANNGPTRKTDAPANSIPDDGLLTALEVTSLDLHNVDLVVLSACDTSVGLIEDNESTMGLQQSFQIAGARATISSLWPVDDAATQALMVEFYRNLWEEKRSQGDALRQAQLTMLNHYDPAKQALSPRGLKLIKPQQADDKEQSRLHPRYWACFTLSGDWR